MNARAVVPDFGLPATGNQRFLLCAFRGHPLAHRFPPKDQAPGRIRQRADPRHPYAQFAKAALDAFGVSGALGSIAAAELQNSFSYHCVPS